MQCYFTHQSSQNSHLMQLSFPSGMDPGHAVFAMVAGLASKDSSKPVNHIPRQPYRNAVNSSFRNSDQTVDGEKTSHLAMTKITLQMG